MFLPIEFTMENESPEEILEEFQTAPSLESKEGFLAKLIESRSNILEKAKANISAAQEKQKADYDCKHAAKDPPAKDPPAKDPPAKDPPAKDPPAKDPPAKDPPAKDPPAKDPPAKDPPSKDPPAKDPPAKDPPAKDSPAKDSPAKDSPAKDPHSSQDCAPSNKGIKRPLSDAAQRVRKKKRIQMSAKCNSEPQLISSGEEDNESEQTKWQKIHGVTLTQKDRDIIMNGEWLNDNIINAAQCLMKHDLDLLPVGSLQNPLLGQTVEFDVISDESVQILHSGGNHWITISTVGTKHPTVKVFDSLYNELPWETKEQIAALLQTKESTITLEFANAQVKNCNFTYRLSYCLSLCFHLQQKQRNGADCGVFAIAFAVAICAGPSASL